MLTPTVTYIDYRAHSRVRSSTNVPAAVIVPQMIASSAARQRREQGSKEPRGPIRANRASQR